DLVEEHDRRPVHGALADRLAEQLFNGLLAAPVRRTHQPVRIDLDEDERAERLGRSCDAVSESARQGRLAGAGRAYQERDSVQREALEGDTCRAQLERRNSLSRKTLLSVVGEDDRPPSSLELRVWQAARVGNA